MIGWFCVVAIILTKPSALIPPPAPFQPSTTTIPVPLEDPRLMHDAFRYKESWSVADGTRIILLPHHLIGAKGIASLVSAVPEPTTVYYLAPDHLSGGDTAFSTTDAPLVTAEGGSSPNLVLHQDLLETVPSLSNNTRAFLHEPSALAPIPYFKEAWPNTLVTPILVKLNATEKEQRELIDALRTKLEQDPSALLVSSIDFSHYQTVQVADFHDLIAEDALRALDVESTSSLEIDSPPIFRMTALMARELGLGQVTIHDHTNSLTLLRSVYGKESTSHFYASFSPGAFAQREIVSLLLLGTLDNQASTSTLLSMSGTENRFFSGQDMRFFSTDAPRTVTLQSAGYSLHIEGIQTSKTATVTHLKTPTFPVDLIAMDKPMTVEDETDLLTKVKASRESGAHVIAWIKWRNQAKASPANSEQRLAESLIDAGAEAVVGITPQQDPSFASYKGKPIVFSLGNVKQAFGLVLNKDHADPLLIHLTK